MPFVESFLEFRERMNCPYVETTEVSHKLGVRITYIFENGGHSWGDPPRSPLYAPGRMHYGPEEMTARDICNVRRAYWSEILHYASKEFNELKEGINEQASRVRQGWPGPSQEDVNHLRTLRRKVNIARVKLETIEAEIAELNDPGGLKALAAQEEEQYRRRRSAEAEEIAAEARTITI